ncbi:MAG: hypothetical protein WAN35_17440 [Terracidiphilus sp.]
MSSSNVMRLSCFAGVGNSSSVPKLSGANYMEMTSAAKSETGC